MTGNFHGGGAGNQAGGSAKGKSGGQGTADQAEAGGKYDAVSWKLHA